MVLSFLTQLQHPVPRAAVDRRASTRSRFTYVVIAVPFVVSGVAMCLVLTGFPQPCEPALRGRSRRRGARMRAPHCRARAGPTGRRPCLWVACSRASAASRSPSTPGRGASTRAPSRGAPARAWRRRGTLCWSGAESASSGSSTSKGSFEARSALREVELVFARAGDRRPERPTVPPQGWGLSPRAAADRACASCSWTSMSGPAP